ncbi:HlyD family efflux transporter periplasmic adaptor subunit [Sphingobium indicum]|nr:HlyD family efflux transporter periplasmic adaptor subunit [Sphingobium indicum]NYI21560.1 adhesin transport system membrane fusion protein [Sphingobium indicum]
MEIVPLEDKLLIEARISRRDIAFIRPRLPATVKITAYDPSIYGTVDRISPDTLQDEVNRDQVFYRVYVPHPAFQPADQGRQGPRHHAGHGRDGRNPHRPQVRVRLPDEADQQGQGSDAREIGGRALRKGEGACPFPPSAVRHQTEILLSSYCL